MEEIFVGIDVSKDRLDVYIRPKGETLAVARDSQGLAKLIKHLSTYENMLVALEATGGYETIVADTLASAGLDVAIVNPAQVRAFAHALGKRAKTDLIDAAVIAHFAEATGPRHRAKSDKDRLRLRDLVARRRQLVMMIRGESHRKELASDEMKCSITRMIKAIEKERDRIEGEIDKAVSLSPEWTETEKLLTSVPGVGNTIARTLMFELPELGHLSRREIASLVGLAPWTRQSGKWRGKSFIGGGRSRVRGALFMAAMVAARHNPPMKAFRERLLAAGKPRLVIIIAIARKITTILNAILRDQKPWSKDMA